MKRLESPRFIENPFVKRQNREWSIPIPSSLQAPVSPPRTRRESSLNTERDKVEGEEKENAATAPNLAAVEAGKAKVQDPVEVFSASLREATRPRLNNADPRLAHDDWIALYMRNQHPHGRHFVIHQHDHPVAGPHYDLRLQFSESSSLSFAIMYGLPGDPNSRRLNRNATETRVHNLWNHLIESASSTTGSLLIWDTGEYSILPYYKENAVETDHSQSTATDGSTQGPEIKTESEKLRESFGKRKIRLRLHGTRLPPNYTVTLRLTTSNNTSTQPKKPVRKRRRKTLPNKPPSTPSTSPSPSPPLASRTGSSTPLPQQEGTTSATPNPETPDRYAGHSDPEDETTRLTNAYPGATNSISSIHQRKWFLSLDRENTGFERRVDPSDGRQRWLRRRVVEDNGAERLLGFEPFYVRGPDVERSVVTGRLGRDVLNDEGVEGYVGRRGWRPVLQ